MTELEVEYTIVQWLYIESRINDASRIFSWCRKSSKSTLKLEQKLLDELSNG